MKKFLVMILSLVMVFAMTSNCFANDVDIEPSETEVLLEDELELVIPYQTYDEFVAGLTFEEVDGIPEGAAYCTSVKEFYDKIYAPDVMPLVSDKVAERSLGDLNATFYATIDGSLFVRLNNISSDISPLLLGIEWEQERYTHEFTDRNHVVKGDIYGRLRHYLVTPVGFVKVGTDSFKVPYELSTSAFN